MEDRFQVGPPHPGVVERPIVEREEIPDAVAPVRTRIGRAEPTKESLYPLRHASVLVYRRSP